MHENVQIIVLTIRQRSNMTPTVLSNMHHVPWATLQYSRGAASVLFIVLSTEYFVLQKRFTLIGEDTSKPQPIRLFTS